MPDDFDVALVSQGLDTPAAATPSATPPVEPTTVPPVTTAVPPVNDSSSEKPATPDVPATPPANPNPTPEVPVVSTPAVPPTEPANPAAPAAPSSPAPTVPTQDDAANVLRQQLQTEMFKSLGVNSLEELQEKLKPPVVETPEQIAQRERQYNAELDAFAIKNNLITKDEIVQLETLKKADPQSVVFSQYAEAYKAKHTDATPEQVSAAFRLAYHLDSETPAFKEHGESLIKNQYDSIVNSLEGKYTTAKDSFHSEVTQRSQMPAFKSFIKSSLDSFVPSKLELVTDGDVKVTLDVDPALRAEIEKELVNNDTFNQFTGSKDAQQLRDAVKAKIEGSLQRRHFEAIKKTIYEAGKAAGMKQGSTTGATHPFPLNTTPVTPVPVEVGITKADDARLANIFG